MSYFVKRVSFRRPDQPEPVYTAALSLWEAYRFPPIGDAERNSVRTGAQGSLDVRLHCDLAPQNGWIARVVESTVSTWAPAFVPSSSRVGARASLELRGADWNPQPAWIFSAVPSGASTAQLWPAIQQNTGLSYRSSDRPKLDVRGSEWSSEDGWRQRVVESVISTWTPAFADTGGRSADRAPGRPDIQPQPAWIFSSVPVGTTTAQQWPAILQGLANSVRTVTGPRVDVRGGWDRGVFGVPVPDDATVDQQVPAWIQASGLSFRSQARKGDVRAVDTAGQQGWIFTNLPSPATTAQLWPAILEGLQPSYRSAERAKLDVRAFEWGPPGWIFATLPVPTTTAQQWPAVLQALQPSYRSEERPRLDVRKYEWSPEFTWPAKVVDGIVAKWAPVFNAELGYRSEARRPLNVRDSSWNPELAWQIAYLPIGPAVHPDEFFLVGAQDRWFVVTASGLLVPPPSQSAVILARTPKAFWRLGESVGPLAHDQITSAQDLTITGGVTLGRSGAIWSDTDTAFQFNGTTGKLTGSVSISGATGFALSLWVNGNGHTWSAAGEVFTMLTGPGKFVTLSINSGTVFGNVPVSSANKFLFSTSLIPTTGWHQIVLSWTTGEKVKLYIDGVLDNQSGAIASGTLDTVTGAFVGVDNTGAQFWLTGVLDEIALYGAPLTAAQIAADWAAHSTMSGRWFTVPEGDREFEA